MFRKPGITPLDNANDFACYVSVDFFRCQHRNVAVVPDHQSLGKDTQVGGDEHYRIKAPRVRIGLQLQGLLGKEPQSLADAYLIALATRLVVGSDEPFPFRTRREHRQYSALVQKAKGDLAGQSPARRFRK